MKVKCAIWFNGSMWHLTTTHKKISCNFPNFETCYLFVMLQNVNLLPIDLNRRENKMYSEHNPLILFDEMAQFQHDLQYQFCNPFRKPYYCINSPLRHILRTYISLYRRVENFYSSLFVISINQDS